MSPGIFRAPYHSLIREQIFDLFEILLDFHPQSVGQVVDVIDEANHEHNLVELVVTEPQVSQGTKIAFADGLRGFVKVPRELQDGPCFVIETGRNPSLLYGLDQVVIVALLTEKLPVKFYSILALV